MCLALLFVVMVGVFVGVWRLTARPVSQLREDTELALRGHLREVKSTVKWPPMTELAHSINRVFARVEGGAPGGGGGGDDRPLRALVQASAWPVLVLDAQSRVLHINDAALYVFGVQREAAAGRSVMELMTDPEIADKMTRMLQAVGSGQAPIVAEPVVLAGEQRRLTVAGEPRPSGGSLDYAVVVIA